MTFPCFEGNTNNFPPTRDPHTVPIPSFPQKAGGGLLGATSIACVAEHRHLVEDTLSNALRADSRAMPLHHHDCLDCTRALGPDHWWISKSPHLAEGFDFSAFRHCTNPPRRTMVMVARWNRKRSETVAVVGRNPAMVDNDLPCGRLGDRLGDRGPWDGRGR